MSGESLNLDGVRIDGGVTFTFPAVEMQPGQRMVVAADPATLRSRYGDSLVIAGQYSGRLSNRDDEIELLLPEPFAVVIQRFRYSDQWYTSTDGLGRSLVIRDPLLPLSRWQEAGAWRASRMQGGSPGRPDPDPLPGDLSADGTVDVVDIDLLSTQVRRYNQDADYDLTRDGVVASDDREYLLSTILHAMPGDANLDGRFDSQDLIEVFVAGQYEDTVAENSLWSSGDWDGDGEFDSNDLVLAFQRGTYERTL